MTGGGASQKKVVLVYRSDLLLSSETFIKEQVRSLRSWDAILIGHRRGPLALDGLNSVMLGPGQPPFIHRAVRKIGRMAGLIPYRMSLAVDGMAPTTLARLRACEPALLHAHFGIDAVAAWSLAQELGLPMLVTLHGYDINIRREVWESGKKGKAMREYPSRLLALAAESEVRFIAVSEALRQRAIAFGLPPEKICVRYIGVDVQSFRLGSLPLAQRPRHVLFVGRLVEKKGCHHLISAMAEVRKRLPEVELVIVGDGPLRRDLEEQAISMGVRAGFLGTLPPDGVRREMDRAAVFCLPSITARDGDAEGLPIVLLEAQAMGVPVVTSALGGSTEGIADGETGFAFTEGDVDALAEKLIRLLSNPELANRVRVRGREFVSRHFELGSCTSLLEIVYNEVCR